MSLYDGALSRLVLSLALGSLVVWVAASAPAAAESRKISGTATVLGVLSQTTMGLGDKPGHEVGLTRHVEVDRSSDADFNNVQYDVVETSDHVGGSGTHHGYRVSLVPGPDKLYSAYEGTTKVVSHSGGAAPDITFEGKWWFTGGTGKFQGITGGGTYKGRAAPAGVTWEWQGQYEIKK